MEKITKEQYEQAKVIVDKYNSHLEAEYQEKLSKIRADLTEYFSKNEVCGETIKEFRVERHWLIKDFNSAELIPVDPMFDEDYWDDKADADIEAIGQKYGIRLGWESGVYGK